MCTYKKGSKFNVTSAQLRLGFRFKCCSVRRASFVSLDSAQNDGGNPPRTGKLLQQTYQILTQHITLRGLQTQPILDHTAVCGASQRKTSLFGGMRVSPTCATIARFRRSSRCVSRGIVATFSSAIALKAAGKRYLLTCKRSRARATYLRGSQRVRDAAAVFMIAHGRGAVRTVAAAQI